MTSEGLPRRLRLRRRREFLRVQRSGDKHHTRHFLVFVAPRFNASAGPSRGPQGSVVTRDSPQRLLPTRLGVTVTRKVGGAVIRNRIKRLVREAFRRNRQSFPTGRDMVWVAKRVAAEADYAAVESEMNGIARRLGRDAGASAVGGGHP